MRAAKVEAPKRTACGPKASASAGETSSGTVPAEFMPMRMIDETRPTLPGSQRCCMSVVRTGASAPKPIPVMTWPTAATTTKDVPV